MRLIIGRLRLTTKRNNGRHQGARTPSGICALQALTDDKRNEARSLMDGAGSGHLGRNEIAAAQFPAPNQINARLEMNRLGFQAARKGGKPSAPFPRLGVQHDASWNFSNRLQRPYP